MTDFFVREDETVVLRLSLRTVSQALDRLVGACTGPDGKPRAPTQGELSRARSMLPPTCEHSFKKDRV